MQKFITNSNWGKKIIKYQKKDHFEYLNILIQVYSNLYQKNIIQERSFSFFSYYLKYGNNFFEILSKKLNCLESDYIILKGF